MKIKNIFKEWGIPIIAVVVLFFVIRQYVFFTAVIPSESMMPTLEIKDRLITSRIFNVDKLENGEVVVFVGGGAHKHMHIKRIIGLPGDKISLKENGDVYVNGKLLEEPYAIKAKEDKHEHSDCGHEENHIEPKLGEYEVPEGMVFFLGDNRGASYDSRYWENPYISMDEIVGKPLFRLWPFSRFGKIK